MFRKWALYILCNKYPVGTVFHYRYIKPGLADLFPFRLAGGGILRFNKEDLSE